MPLGAATLDDNPSYWSVYPLLGRGEPDEAWGFEKVDFKRRLPQRGRGKPTEQPPEQFQKPPLPQFPHYVSPSHGYWETPMTH